MSRLRAFADHHRRELPLVLALIAAVAHAHFFFATSASYFRWDSGEYLAAAKNLASGHGFRDVTGAIEARRTPGYPLFMLPFLVAGLGPKAIVIAQHLVAILLAPAAYFLTLILTNNSLAATFAGLFVAIDSGQIYMANHVMTETLMSLVLLGIVAALIGFVRRESILLAAVAGLFVSFSVLVRPAAVYLWIPLAVWFFFAAREKRAMAVATFVICAVALPLFWMWRNYERAGAAVLSSIGGQQLYYYRAAGTLAMERTGFTFVPLPFAGEEAFRKEFFRVMRPRFVIEANEAHRRAFGSAKMTDAQISDFDGRVARHILLAHWRAAALMTLNGALHLLFDSTWDYASALSGGWTWIFLLTILFINSVLSVVLAVIGFARLRRVDARSAWLLAIVLLYFLAVLSGPENEQWRFRVPLIPVCAILVGCSLMRSAAPAQ